jgi:hypothetical protein
MSLDISDAAAHRTALMTGAVLPATFSGQLYLYDFAQLALFTSGLILLFRERWVFFYPIYALACINKETSILLAIVFAFWRGKQILRPQGYLHLACQLIIGGVIISYAAWIFKNNPGGNVYWFLERNLALDFSFLAWFRLTVLMTGIMFAVWKIWAAPRFLSCGFYATAPFLLVATLFFGYIDEFRDYYESIPFIVSLSLLRFRNIKGRASEVYAKDR